MPGSQVPHSACRREPEALAPPLGDIVANIYEEAGIELIIGQKITGITANEVVLESDERIEYTILD